MIDVLAIPFLACLMLTAIHVPLGLHVLTRGVIFVDLALAQVAALGLSVAFLAGHALGSDAAYWYALAFAAVGAVLLAIAPPHGALPQEAVIGIVYAVSTAVAVLVVDRAPQGAEYIKQLLVGSLLTVDGADVRRLAVLYAGVGALHWLARRPLLEISRAPELARARGRCVRAWDVIFYGSFALVVTSSVRVAGVLLVFGYLVMPAAAAALLAQSVRGRLALAWTLGVVASALALVGSYAADLPTSASVVALLGASVALVAGGRAARVWAQRARARGVGALRPALAGAGAAIAIAGTLLAAVPHMDHHWLDWIEAGVPALEDAFLTPTERGARRDSARAVVEARAQLAALSAVQADAQWGARPLDADRAERLRQFLAGRAEIAAGDRLVLATLRAKARARQRWWLGGALAGAGVALAWAARRHPRRQAV